MPRIVGIDPGARITLACTDDDGAVQFSEQTAVVVKRGKHNRTTPVPALVANILRQWHPDLVIVEAVQPVGKSGEAKERSPMTGGNLMHSRGIAEGCAAGIGIVMYSVAPSVWTRAMKVKGGPEAARLRALELHPALAEALARKLDHNRAAAYLIAEWGRRFVLPQHPLF